MEARAKGMPLHTKILIGLALGFTLGLVANWTLGRTNSDLKWFNETISDPAGKLFLNLIFMVVVPLLFSALVLGVGELGEAKKVGKIGLLSLLMTVVLSGTAVVIGLTAVNVVKPGAQIPEGRRAELVAQYADKKKADASLKAAQTAAEDPPLLGFVPKNPFKEVNRALEGGLLPLMFFALLFGIALASIEPERAAPVSAFFDGVFAVSQKIIEFAMRFAPIGVFFLVFQTASTLGIELFVAVGLFVVLVLGSLALHQFGTYSLALRFIAKRNPAEFFRSIRGVMLTAFATSSSNATLPVALRSAEEEVKLPRDVSSFVLTVGATANQNGTALFEGMTILFLCQLFNVPLDLGQQLTIMGLAIVGGIGTAGIPGGAWPMIATILVMFKVPAEAIGIVFGIDRILDMSRTVLNVSGDMTIAACVSQLAGRTLDEGPHNPPLEPGGTPA
ncbi:MAG: dicarboxylate/amino acid:cation symporter [Fimbriimonas sp.]